jgi:hypothetical protein
VKTLLPYDGGQLAALAEARHGRTDGSAETTQFASDRSGLVRYRFNSAGFRGDEYDPDAHLRVAVFGCSYTFGLGLPYEDCWPSQLRALLAELHGLAPGAVNLVNLSSPGSSNAFIARTLLGQCHAVDFDLVLAYFTHANRHEYYCDSQAYNLGPWVARQDPAAIAEDPAREALQAAAQSYYSFFEMDWGLADALKSILLAQFFLQSRGIPFIFGCVDEGWSSSDFPVLVHLRELLDPARVFPVGRPLLKQFIADTGTVAAHPGRNGAQQIAQLFLQKYRDAGRPGA